MATNIAIAKPLTIAAFAESSEVATLTSANLGEPQPSDVWRTTGDSAEYVEMDLGAAAAVDLVALMFTNLTAAATWRVRAATSQGNLTAAPGYDSGVVTAHAGATVNVAYPHALLYLAAAETYRWWRIDLADAANPDGYIQAGVAVLANAIVPTRNYAYGATRGYIDDSTKKKGFGGQIIFEPKSKRPFVSVALPYLTQDEMEADMLELQRTLTGPVLVVIAPDANTYRQGRMYYGTLEIVPLVVEGFNRCSMRISVEGWI